MTKRILIAGGFGYVGGRLASLLIANGFSVRLAGRERRHPPSWLSSAEVAPIVWSNCETLAAACDGCDVVIQAAGTNAHDSQSDPDAAFALNVEGTRQLAVAAKNAGVKRFIYLSTVHVYASPLAGCFDEQAPLNNKHPYAASHAGGESAALALANQQMGVHCLRVSNAFGPPMHRDVNCWTLLLNDLCRQAVSGDGWLRLTSDGTAHRDFIPMETLVSSISFLLRDDVAPSPVLNLALSQTYSLKEMAQVVQRRAKTLLGIDLKVKTTPTITSQPHKALKIDIRALTSLGFTPSKAFDDEVDALLRFCDREFGRKQ